MKEERPAEGDVITGIMNELEENPGTPDNLT
jgi:hypothetical protein